MAKGISSNRGGSLTVVGFQKQPNQDLVNGGTITLSGEKMEAIDVDASAGAAVLANEPFGTSPANFKDRAVIAITCLDIVNPVTINSNDVQYGYVGNGNLVLTQGHQVQFIYNASLERFLELSRNF